MKSFLDLDSYKCTMGQFVWKHFPDAVVKYEFKNRTKDVRLAEIVHPSLVEFELRKYSRLRITDEEALYLKSLGMFEDEYINFLKKIQLSKPIVSVTEDGQLSISVEGRWCDEIYWETVVLSVVNELYCSKISESVDKNAILEDGRNRLLEKISVLKKYPSIRFSDFGTRRRHSLAWQENVLNILLKEIPEQLIGTSNVYLAMKLGLMPIGTQAHELLMIGSVLFGNSDADVLSSHGKILDMWYEYYGERLSIALTDTYGTEFLFRDFGKERAEKWKGLRQDSGDPFAFASKAIEFYSSFGINPNDKTIVFSDGLDVNKIIALHNSYSDKINVTFGWGTNLSQDFSAIKPLSLVMKAVECNGNGLVKLSDNMSKATGTNENIERFKRVFGYSNVNKEKLIY